MDYATVLLGTGTGSFAASGSVSSYFNGAATAAVADVNNDGKQDFVLGGTAGYIATHLGDGTGALGATISSYVPYSYTAQRLTLTPVG